MAQPTEVADGAQALFALDTMLAGQLAEENDVESSTPTALYNRLVRDLWWRACAEAVTEAPHRLLDWWRGADTMITSILTGQSNDESDEEPALDAAMAVAAIGVALAAARGNLPQQHIEPAVRSAIGYWLAASVLPQTPTDGLPPFDGVDLPDDIRTVFDAIQSRPPTFASRHAMVATVLLAAAVPVPRFEHRVRVLFDTSGDEQDGRRGELELAVLPGGPPGLYPAPRTMSFLRGNRRFAMALTAAWAYAGDAGNRCVIWSITHQADRLPPITGGSLGAPFAVALLELARPWWRRRVSWRVFNSERAVTGTLGPNGEVGEVGGLGRKFAIAKAADWGVIAPAASRPPDEQGIPHGLDVRWVSDVRGVRRHLTRWMWRRVLYVVAPVMVLAIGLVAALAVNQRLDIQTANNAIARRDNTVTELDEEANTQRTDQPILSMRLGLAADALKDSPTTRSALISTLTSGLPHNTLLSGQGTVRSAAFGPNGLVMTADDAGTILWNITQLSAPILVAHLETQSTQTAAMSANGQVVITSPVDSDELEFWDTTRPAVPHLLTSIRTNCQPVSISVASSLPIALSGCANGTATLWDLRVTNDPRNSGNLAPPPTGLHSVALASDGTAAMVASDHGLSTWSIDPALGSHLDTPDYTQVNNEASNGTIRPAYSVAVDPSGQIAVVGQDDMAAELAHSVEAENRPVPAATLDLHNGGGDMLASGVDNQADRAITASPGNTATVWQLHDENGTSTYTPMAEL